MDPFSNYIFGKAAEHIIDKVSKNKNTKAITLAAEKAKKRAGGGHDRWIYSADFTSGSVAGHYATTAQIQDLKAVIDGLNTNAQDSLIIDRSTITLYLNCDQPFTMQPFLCYSENGNELPNYETTEPTLCDPQQIAKLAFATLGTIDHSIIPFEVIQPRQIMSNGGRFWVAEMSYDITAVMQKYARSAALRELSSEEGELPEFSFSAVSKPRYTGSAETVYQMVIQDLVYHMNKRSFGF